MPTSVTPKGTTPTGTRPRTNTLGARPSVPSLSTIPTPRVVPTPRGGAGGGGNETPTETDSKFLTETLRTNQAMNQELVALRQVIPTLKQVKAENAELRRSNANLEAEASQLRTAYEVLEEKVSSEKAASEVTVGAMRVRVGVLESAAKSSQEAVNAATSKRDEALHQVEELQEELANVQESLRNQAAAFAAQRVGLATKLEEISARAEADATRQAENEAALKRDVEEAERRAALHVEESKRESEALIAELRAALEKQREDAEAVLDSSMEEQKAQNAELIAARLVSQREALIAEFEEKARRNAQSSKQYSLAEMQASVAEVAESRDDQVAELRRTHTMELAASSAALREASEAHEAALDALNEQHTATLRELRSENARLTTALETAELKLALLEARDFPSRGTQTPIAAQLTTSCAVGPSTVDATSSGVTVPHQVAANRRIDVEQQVNFEDPELVTAREELLRVRNTLEENDAAHTRLQLLYEEYLALSERFSDAANDPSNLLTANDAIRECNRELGQLLERLDHAMSSFGPGLHFSIRSTADCLSTCIVTTTTIQSYAGQGIALDAELGDAAFYDHEATMLMALRRVIAEQRRGGASTRSRSNSLQPGRPSL